MTGSAAICAGRLALLKISRSLGRCGSRRSIEGLEINWGDTGMLVRPTSVLPGRSTREVESLRPVRSLSSSGWGCAKARSPRRAGDAGRQRDVPCSYACPARFAAGDCAPSPRRHCLLAGQVGIMAAERRPYRHRRWTLAEQVAGGDLSRRPCDWHVRAAAGEIKKEASRSRNNAPEIAPGAGQRRRYPAILTSCRRAFGLRK